MITQEDLQVTINEKKFKLKITLGFWKRCGFKKDEAEIINDDVEKLYTSLKLAIFYGNKEEYNWKTLDEMKKTITDEMIEDIDEDLAEKLSYAMIYFLPMKLRQSILKKMNEVDDKVETMIGESIDASLEDTEQPDESTDQKKN